MLSQSILRILSGLAFVASIGLGHGGAQSIARDPPGGNKLQPVEVNLSGIAWMAGAWAGEALRGGGWVRVSSNEAVFESSVQKTPVRLTDRRSRDSKLSVVVQSDTEGVIDPGFTVAMQRARLGR